LTKWYSNGQKQSEEYFKDGEKGKFFTYWNENGSKSREVRLENGIINFSNWYMNGQKEFEEFYKDGENNGVWITWYENGKIRSKSKYKGGLRYAVNKEKPFTGTHIILFEDGQKNIETHYKDGVKDGVHIEWDESGRKRLEENWKGGKKSGELMWRSDGGQCISWLDCARI